MTLGRDCIYLFYFMREPAIAFLDSRAQGGHARDFKLADYVIFLFVEIYKIYFGS